MGGQRRSTEKDGKHKMSTNRGVSPSLSLTLWSRAAGVGVREGQAESEERIFQGLHRLTGGDAVNEGGGIKKRR